MIQGKIRAQYCENRIENMPIGAIGFMFPEDIIVTKKACFISIYSEVFYQDEDDEFDLSDYVGIKRIGPGLTDQDFEINVSQLDQEIYLDLETHAVYLELIKESGFLVYHNFELVLGDEDRPVPKKKGDTDIKDEVSRLNDELKKAIDSDAFEKAAKLRDKIKSISKKKKK